ncbi:hypothetical protein L228DRAFT_261841 [Xylona heveae TC161]|uniref:Nuclear pore complex protein An-Nup82 n=1 Tax=Xylona heveae (strain CBS 132557 / TC161) TaxID=1328760 RepID=A0A165G3L3_XYLHT|nr:hypothetical protein L228DRAFT_261841 [Xylona heveae TC161]KZF21699.1 hypothetical protein L228DRAFT_261841 [Xylona heveae TC161]
MPRILSYTPSWLLRPSPGFDVFAGSPKRDILPSKTPSQSSPSKDAPSKDGYLGPARNLAHRGTEVFVVVDNQIRWAGLSLLKVNWKEQEERKEFRKLGGSRDISSPDEEASDASDIGSYRVLKVPVTEKIRQLVPSPQGDYLAILTSHTVHIAILPDSSHLGQPDSGPIRLKTHTLGPTAHVLSQSPVVSALWHPLGVAGSTLVTVTAEAVVRVWELNRDNRWSFDSPTLAVDLKKLANATTAEADTAPSTLGSNKGFSPDSFEMEVASACFGGTGLDEEHGWASMTLWVAMREGDVYALCPLLPSKWQSTSTLIPSLSTSVMTKAASQQSEQEVSELDRVDCEYQFRWFSDIDNQEPLLVPGRSEFVPPLTVYSRPSHPGPVPRLQGPFQIEAMPEDEGPEEVDELLTDICVAGAKVDVDELMIGEEWESQLGDFADGGLSAGIVCTLANTGRVRILLDLNGVEASWLPHGKSLGYLEQMDSLPSLLHFDSLNVMKPSDIRESTWPLFTADTRSRYSFFITHGNGISYMSLTTWVEALEAELANSTETGATFRLERLAESFKTLSENVMHFSREQDPVSGKQSPDLFKCIVLQDSDLGYFLLTLAGERPQALTFDVPDLETLLHDDDGAIENFEPSSKPIIQSQPRPAYQPPEYLWLQSAMPKFLDEHVHDRHRRALKEEIRLSTATLDLMTQAHRVLSRETYQLGLAAADLFRRCERLREDFRDQIRRANEVANRIEEVTGEDADAYDNNEGEEEEQSLTADAKVEKRLAAARARQDELLARHEALRRKVAKLGGRELSDKEQAWGREIQRLKSSVLGPSEANGSRPAERSPRSRAGALWKRYEEVKNLADDLVSEAKELGEPAPAQDNSQSQPENINYRVPSDVRKAKMAQVMNLLERETALVEATRSRLERLSGLGS